MKVFKFGGASVKDAEGVRNLARVLHITGHQGVLLVISAMGKTTNALEEVLTLYFNQQNFHSKIDEIEQNHLNILRELIPNNIDLQNVITSEFKKLKTFLEGNKSPNYDYVYDQVVSFGEIVSTKIISFYLNSLNFDSHWIDAREYIKTDNTYREGKVDWENSCKQLNQLKKDQFYITQGFIGADPNFFTTTLGREGSDYTGAIIAYCLNAESLTIWKDVPGVLNADPRYFSNAQQLFQISYEEAIELAYYGASVIHPKTLQPLQRKQIPLYVKSFENPENQGTVIQNGKNLTPEIACYIVKQNQSVLRIATKDFSFIDEAVIRDVFLKLADNKLKVNLMQISAISLSLCVEDKYNRMEYALSSFRQDFDISVTPNCALYTIRHAGLNAESQIPNASKPLIRQSGINTLQLVICDE